jgi:hypothetical protein
VQAGKDKFFTSSFSEDFFVLPLFIFKI